MVDNRLFVLGGYTGDAVSRRKILTLEKVEGRYVWRVYGEMNADRVFASAVSLKGVIYVLGGTTQFEALDARGNLLYERHIHPKLFGIRYGSSESEAGGNSPPYPGKSLCRNGLWPLFYSAANPICDVRRWLSGACEGSGNRFDGVLKFDILSGKWHWSRMSALPKAIGSVQPCAVVVKRPRFSRYRRL